MFIDQASNSLFNTKKELIKTFDCPLSKKWESMSRTESDVLRFCGACQKDVIDITGFDESQIIALFEVKPSACAHLNIRKAVCDIRLINAPSDENRCIKINADNLPIINTARDITAINKAVKAGFIVDIRPTHPDQAPESKVRISQDEQGDYQIEGYDFRSFFPDDAEMVYQKSGVNLSAFAAYMIPRDLVAGTRVFVPDIIEHVVESSWNQGDQYRLHASAALWDGEHIIIDEVVTSEICG